MPNHLKLAIPALSLAEAKLRGCICARRPVQERVGNMTQFVETCRLHGPSCVAALLTGAGGPVWTDGIHSGPPCVADGQIAHCMLSISLHSGPIDRSRTKRHQGESPSELQPRTPTDVLMPNGQDRALYGSTLLTAVPDWILATVADALPLEPAFKFLQFKNGNCTISLNETWRLVMHGAVALLANVPQAQFVQDRKLHVGLEKGARIGGRGRYGAPLGLRPWTSGT